MAPTSQPRGPGHRGPGTGDVPSGGDRGTGPLPQNQQETAAIIADEWRKAGMSEAGIAGIGCLLMFQSGDQSLV